MKPSATHASRPCWAARGPVLDGAPHARRSLGFSSDTDILDEPEAVRLSGRPKRRQYHAHWGIVANCRKTCLD